MRSVVASFKEAFAVTLRLCREAVTTQRLRDEVARQEQILVAQRNAIANDLREQARAAEDLSTPLNQAEVLRRLAETNARLRELATAQLHSRARLVAVEARYRSLTGAPFGRWLLRLLEPATRSNGHVQRAERWLSLIELLVPRRLRQEEIGDAREIIRRLAAEGHPGWQRCVTVKVISTSFWVLVNAVRDLAAGIFGQKSA
jgi:hypothetical protein